jgi:type I restriction enzyme S subunit
LDVTSELLSTTLGAISSDISYGYTERASNEKIGPRFLRITDIQNGIVDWESVPYCSITEKKYRKYKLHYGDIVVARTGNSTGENYFFNSDEEAVFASYLIRFRINNSLADSRFVWYAMRSPSWWLYVNSAKSGSAQAGANAKVLSKFPINLPTLSEQRAIAHILGALDDKIELNRRMSETLEAIAQALFKDWFVDFGPVRAKMEGCWQRGQSLPGLPAYLYDIFPENFVESELGEIPNKWAIKSLNAIADLVTNSISPYKHPEHIYEHYSIPAFDFNRMPVIEKGEMIRSNKYVVQKDAVLVSKLNPQTPRIWLPLCKTNHAICSTEFMQFVPHQPDNRSYLYFLMNSQYLKNEILKHVTGSTGSRQRAQPSQVVHLRALHPTSEVLSAFGLQVKPILQHITIGKLEQENLSEIRNTLLPKLILGKIRVKDAERIVGDAT